MGVLLACGGDSTIGSSGPNINGVDGGTSSGNPPPGTEPDSGGPPPNPLGPVRSVVTVGNGFGCLLTAERDLSCWGRNDLGQLGRDPATTPSCGSVPCATIPAKVEGLTDVERIMAGDDFMCALDAADVVWCWGDNSKGQLGSAGPSTFTPQKAFIGAKSIDAAGAHACVVTKDDLVRCWGDNTCDLFGSGGGVKTATQPPGLPRVSQVSVGHDEICALVEGRPLCWGADHRGSLGHNVVSAGTCGNGASFDPVPKSVQTPTNDLPLEGIAEVRVGAGFGCARRDNGQITCWGDNSRGSVGLGVPDTDTHARAVDVTALVGAQLSVRGGTACTITAGKVFCWGDGQYGQLDGLRPASGSPPSCAVAGCRGFPHEIEGMSDTREVFVGVGAIGAVKNDAKIWMWGRNGSGELAISISDGRNQSCAGSLCVPLPVSSGNFPVLD